MSKDFDQFQTNKIEDMCSDTSIFLTYTTNCVSCTEIFHVRYCGLC